MQNSDLSRAILCRPGELFACCVEQLDGAEDKPGISEHFFLLLGVMRFAGCGHSSPQRASLPGIPATLVYSNRKNALQARVTVYGPLSAQSFARKAEIDQHKPPSKNEAPRKMVPSKEGHPYPPTPNSMLLQAGGPNGLRSPYLSI
jgi:hypothetical protein